MKYLILLSAIWLLSIQAFPQDCSPEILAQKTGTWKPGRQGSVQNVTASDLTKEKSVLANIHKMISSVYHPMGCQVTYSTAYGKVVSDGQVFEADPYYYAMYILRYLCDNNTPDLSDYYVDVSTATTVNIVVNAIYSLNLYAATIPDDDFRGYFKLEKRPEKKDGYYYLGEKVVGDSHLENKIMEYRWLITYNETLPFTYVSRKEYLLIQQKRLEKTLETSPGEREYAKKWFDRISEELAKPEDELSQPAICMWNDEERFEGFVEEGTRDSFIAIKPDMEYYQKDLPLSSPQFFTVVYKLSQGNPVFETNISAIKEAVDFAALRGMLGK